jgi:putative transposase
MRRIDEVYLATPFYGSRRMMAVECHESWTVNRKRVRRLMRVMRIEAIYQKSNTSRRHLDHIVYPDLLRSLAIDQPNQIWCTDIIYISMSKGFVYLGAVGAADAFRNIDPLRGSDGLVQPSGSVLACGDPAFCAEALQGALDRYGALKIVNTDQRVRFTSAELTGVLTASGVRISMDGKGPPIWTTSLSNGCGVALSMRTFTSRPMWSAPLNWDTEICYIVREEKQ